MSSPADLLETAEGPSDLSTSYGMSSMSAKQFSNVRTRHMGEVTQGNPEVNPQYKGNLGRKAAMFGNFRNATPGVGGTFYPSEDEPFQTPHSDPGSPFALQKQDDYIRAA